MLCLRAQSYIRAASFSLPVLPCSWHRSSASTSCFVCPHHRRALSGYLKPRVSVTVAPQPVTGHVFHFINKIIASLDRGFCPLIVSLSPGQWMGMTFGLCSHFHNDIRGQASTAKLPSISRHRFPLVIRHRCAPSRWSEIRGG